MENKIKELKNNLKGESLKVAIHSEILVSLHETYKKKNHDYGDSFSKVRTEFPISVLIRLSDKLERLKTLYKIEEGVVEDEAQVVEESIEDTLKDLANYAIMEIVERTIPPNC